MPLPPARRCPASVAGGGGVTALPVAPHPVALSLFYLLNFCIIFYRGGSCAFDLSMAKRCCPRAGPCHKSQPLSQWQRRAGDGRSHPLRRGLRGSCGRCGWEAWFRETEAGSGAEARCRGVRHGPLHTGAPWGSHTGGDRQPAVGESDTARGTLWPAAVPRGLFGAGGSAAALASGLYCVLSTWPSLSPPTAAPSSSPLRAKALGSCLFQLE